MPLLEGNPHIDEIIEFPRSRFRGASGVFRVAGWARTLRERVQPDLILDFQGLLRSALICRLCKRAGTRLLGLSDAREGSRWFYDEVAETSGHLHAVDRYLALTRTAAGDPETPELEWHLPAGEKPPNFDVSEPFVVVHPFSRGEGKSLGLEQVSDFARAMAPHRVVIVGNTPKRLAEISPNVIDLLNGTTLPELIWLLRAARFTVSVDSGPMHIAAALTHRLVSIHTWSDPAKVGPYRRNAWVWKDGKLYTQGDRDNPSGWRNVPGMTALADFVETQL
jgi:heptosyltransferase I